MASLAGSVPSPRPRTWTLVVPRAGAGAGVTAGVALLVALVAFGAAGGQRLERTTTAELLLLAAGATLAAAAVLAGPARRLHGGLALLALAALSALTVASIVWSLAPADSWVEASRTTSYLAAFAGALALVRLAPHAWPGVLRGIGLGCLAVCGWALLTRVFPGALAEDELYARLREPLSYWNAVGLMAALGVPPLLWLGARRSGHPAANALAWPGLGLLLVCLLLSYSRGALLALVLGLAFWFAVVPLRLRGALALGAAALASAPIVAWAFANEALTQENVPVPVRADAGHELGAMLVLLAAFLLVAGLAVNFALDRRPPAPRTRRAAGLALAALGLAALLAVPVVAANASGGLARQWEQITDPNAPTPANTPGRLTATSSVRARYWREALDVHAYSPWLGTGAGAFGTVRTRVRASALPVRHAHGYAVQTLADLGWLGLGLSAAGVLAWLLAAARATGLRPRDRGLPFDAERVGLLTMATVVGVGALHSLVDWTWFVPATTVIALVCAGWVAGRGPLRARLLATAPAPVPPLPRPRRRPGALRVLGAVAVLAAGVAAAWSAYQPVRAVHAQDAAIARLQRGELAPAAEIAQTATRRNPLAVEPLWDLALVEDARGRPAAAEAALERAVALQPAEAEAWRRLGRFRNDHGRPREAVAPLQAALFLDPQAPASRIDLLSVQRNVLAQEAAAAEERRVAAEERRIAREERRRRRGG